MQEIGGDIIFLSVDGVRLLSATDRIGDFGFAVASRPIQTEVLNLVDTYNDFCSCVVRNKNQYRLFGYKESTNFLITGSVLGTQFADQTAQNMGWAELKGFKVFVVDSVYSIDEEIIVFANSTGFV